MNENLIFLSYRQVDSSPQTLALRLELERNLQAANVFLDTHTIRSGVIWPEYIKHALNAANIVVVLIGPLWLGLDDNGKRRIDDHEDWVRKEVRFALSHKQGRILPILLNDTTCPTPADLPSDLRGLSGIQASILRLDHWRSDVDALVRTIIGSFGFSGKTATYQFPAPDPLKANTAPVGWERLRTEVLSHMPGWSIEFSDDPLVVDYKRIELTRTFVFLSFEQAMQFMTVVGKHSSQIDHHPRWMNLWRSVTIWLSTWDAGHRVTDLDVQFGKLVDRCYKDTVRRVR